MQKKIIALAIAAAFSAPAMAEVTVYGVVDAAVVSTSVKGMKSDIQAISGGLSSSRLGVKSVEDVAGGMKAVAVVEYALDTQTAAGSASAGACTVTGAAPAVVGTPATCSVAAGSSGSGIGATRQAMLALAGDFGTVATGYLQTTGYDFGVKYDPTAGSAVSPLQAVTKANGFLIGSGTAGARAPRALAYISPDMSGVTVAFNYTTDLLGGTGNVASPTDTKTTAYLLSANYTAGPLAVGGVYANETVAGSSAATEFALGASYDLGAAKLFGTYQSQTPNGGSASTVLSGGVVAPVGAGAVAASFAKSSMKTANTNNTGFTIAYLQGLSKTTTAYVAYNSYSNDSTGAGIGGGSTSVPTNAAGGVKDSSLIAIGLNKKF
ncbi:MAG: porin [Sideroxydans sp.]|nr:porin [Sideroxydans sp.]